MNVRPESVGLSSERLARIRPAVEQSLGPSKIAGAVTLVARHGKVVHHQAAGRMDREQDKPMRPDALFSIYSMTKPIVCAALMTLYERGAFQLYDPVAKYIPAFQDLKVYAGGQSATTLVDLERPVTVGHLLPHTSGLTYHFLEYGPVEQLYREMRVCSEKPLADFVEDLLRLPLAFQPGTAYRYSYAHDVVAHLVQILSDRPLDVYLQETFFEPLGMVDTGYWVPPDKLDRLATMYGTGDVIDPHMSWSRWYEGAESAGSRRIDGPMARLIVRPHEVFRGGHGLVSTAMDYYRFCQMLLNGGELDGARVLGRKTIELMASNALHPSLLPYEIGGFGFAGYGYGLGLRTLLDVGQAQIPGSVGEYGWSGAANTYFWIDPVEQMIGVEMAQFQPNGFFSLANDVRVAAYQAIVDQV
jgi:CubicO group peptidase (beta-lactamase class C family)